MSTAATGNVRASLAAEGFATESTSAAATAEERKSQRVLEEAALAAAVAITQVSATRHARLLRPTCYLAILRSCYLAALQMSAAHHAHILVSPTILPCYLATLQVHGFFGERLCGKRGRYGRPARPERLIGRGWPKFRAARSVIWR